MKNTMLKICAALFASVLITMQVVADTTVYTVAAGTAWNATNLINKASTITAITINTGNSGGATNLTYTFNDFPGFNAANGWGNIMRTNAAYATVGSFLTNITKIVTNFSSGDGAGNYVTFTNTFTNALHTYTNTVAASSNAWRVLASGTVGSNSISTISGSFPVIYGLGFTNNNIGKDITITVTYEPAL